MIEKMQFISITGPKNDIDRVMNDYLSHYEIQLESALAELSTVADLTPYIAINPYKESCSRAEELIRKLDTSDLTADPSMKVEDAISAVTQAVNDLQSIDDAYATAESERSRLQTSLDKILPFDGLDFDVDKILHFKAIKYRFGRIAKEYIGKFERYVYDNVDTLFYKCHTDDNYVWGVCFLPSRQEDKIDAIYKSMHFERVYLPDEYQGTPHDAIMKLTAQLEALDASLEERSQKKADYLKEHRQTLYSAYVKLQNQSSNFDVRKLAACTENQATFYSLCGWMTKADAKSLAREVENDDNLYCIIEDDQQNILSKPPTKLKNPRIFKPFEMFVEMYGLPNYHEFDPTIFVALTYTFIFGWMFGDVGQGLGLLIGGFLLYHFKKVKLAGIIGYAGIFSTFFGFMFGSFFGFEDILPAVWLRPVTQMTDVPFIGKLNTVFVFAIGFGMILILITMILHISNAVRQKDFEGTWFDTNGVAGLVFYASAVLVIVLFMTGNPLPAGIVLAVMFILPLILIGFKEPITHALLKKKSSEHTGPVMTVVQAFFELFEVLLSYFSNTLSFVRIGAFAVSHAAMMEVVLMLAGAENGASPNWIVIVLGNAFVCGMEGLIVGIQVLRLEYYEMFSRFYKGDGRPFKPFIHHK